MSAQDKQPLMPVLNINFDDAHRFGHEGVTIENTPILPQEGEMISLEWSYFIADEKALKELEDFELDCTFLVHIVFRKYTPTQVITYVSLLEESEYNRHYKSK